MSERRTWAIESAGGLGYLLAQQLLAAGEHGRGHPGDVGVAGPAVGLGPVGEERPERCPLGRDRGVARADVGRGPGRGPRDGAAHVGAPAHARSRGRATRRPVDCTRSSWSSWPGGIGKELVVSQALGSSRRSNRPVRSAIERHRLALELVDDIDRLDQPTQSVRRRGSAPRSPRRARP